MKNMLKKTLSRMIFIVALLFFCFAGYQIITQVMEYREGDAQYKKLKDDFVDPVLEKGKSKKTIDFEQLSLINKDVVGWIEIEGLEISYPIVQGEDNEYYLTHSFDKTENKLGSIFVDASIVADFNEKNTLIYGHNMKNGSMFGNLKKLKEKGLVQKIPYIYIYTKKGAKKYQIFSFYETAVNSRTYQIQFKSGEEYGSYLSYIKENSIEDLELELSPEDSVITLSTCTGVEDVRFVVHAVERKIE